VFEQDNFRLVRESFGISLPKKAMSLNQDTYYTQGNVISSFDVDVKSYSV
jgi:hypothetical protein